MSKDALELSRRREQRRLEKMKRLEDNAAASVNSGQWEIRTGDCLDEMAKIESGSVDLIFADPPYNIGIDYGSGAKADRRGDHDYLTWCERWVQECYFALAPHGTFWLLINNEYAGQMAEIVRYQNFHRRAWIVWYETFGVCNSSRSNFSRTSRHLFYSVKDSKRFTWNADAVTVPSARQVVYGDKRANSDGKMMDDVWTIPRLTGTCAERLPEFPTQLPLELLRRVVECSSNPGDLVLDPFNGSGTTGVAALQSGRRYLGIDKNPRYVELAALRLKGVKL